MVYLSNSSFKNFKYRIKQRKKTVSFWRDKFPRANRNRWQLSSLTWPSRGARKLKHSFNITGTWTVWESPWVQKHRSFWYGNINRLLAQYKDKGLAAILSTERVIYEATSFWWRPTADMIYRSPQSQARSLSKWRLPEHTMLTQWKDCKKNTKLGSTIIQRSIKPVFRLFKLLCEVDQWNFCKFCIICKQLLHVIFELSLSKISYSLLLSSPF